MLYIYILFVFGQVLASALKDNKRVTRIDLSWNGIRDCGAQACGLAEFCSFILTLALHRFGCCYVECFVKKFRLVGTNSDPSARDKTILGPCWATFASFRFFDHPATMLG